MTNDKLIQALQECEAACNYCADACLGEENVKMMVDCIRLDRECAEICGTTVNLAAIESSRFFNKMVDICREICEACAEECEKHDHDHCKKCAQACRECVKACESYVRV